MRDQHLLIRMAVLHLQIAGFSGEPWLDKLA
jgi:hypothetical protein